MTTTTKDESIAQILALIRRADQLDYDAMDMSAESGRLTEMADKMVEDAGLAEDVAPLVYAMRHELRVGRITIATCDRKPPKTQTGTAGRAE
jgi:hypothetical protein